MAKFEKRQAELKPTLEYVGKKLTSRGIMFVATCFDAKFAAENEYKRNVEDQVCFMFNNLSSGYTEEEARKETMEVLLVTAIVNLALQGTIDGKKFIEKLSEVILNKKE